MVSEKEVINSVLQKPLIKIFVYGTLRKKQRLGFYMEGGEFLGYYYTKGQLMKSEKDNVYIDFDYQQAYTIGEVYMVNFYCLQRINHLEVLSGTFPKGYELNVLPIWKMNEERNNFDFPEDKKEIAFFYKWKNCSTKILTGDYSDDIEPVEEMEKIILEHNRNITPEKLLEIMENKLSIYQSIRF